MFVFIAIISFMIYYIIMIMANIHEVKIHFSAYLAKLRKGETVIVCKRNVPIAEIRAIPQPSKKTRPIGLAKDTFDIPDTFFDPLPEDIIHSFYGKLENNDETST